MKNVLAGLVLVTACFGATPKANAADVVLLIPRALGVGPSFNQQCHKGLNSGWDYLCLTMQSFVLAVTAGHVDGGEAEDSGIKNLFKHVAGIVLLPFALADAPADAQKSLDEVDAKLAAQGYSAEEIAYYNSDMINIVGPAFDGQKLTVDEFKTSVRSLGLHQRTLEALMIE